MKTGAKLFLYTTFFIVLLLNSADASLSSAVDRILSEPSQSNVQYGVHIIDARSGRTLYDRNADSPMIPASNMKLITTAAALHYLGPDFVYQTTIGIKNNALVIKGSGDPLFGDGVIDIQKGREQGWILEDIAKVLIENNVSSVEDIIVDTTVFDDELVHPSWPAAELNRWYACEVSGLNYNGNCVDITCTNNNGRIRVEVDPATSYIKMVNKIRAISSGSGAVGAYRTEKLNHLILRGRCRRQQGPFRVAIERPAAFFAYLLAENLHRHNISIRGQVIERGIGSTADVKIFKVYTTSISECLARANKDSLGLVAESLMKTIAANAHSGRGGSWAEGQRLMNDYLAELCIRPDKYFIDDGSGLSRRNRLSADCITTVLFDINKSSNSQVYKESMAVGGVDGTIDRYFKLPQYKDNIIGKTGYINGVKSFSGYCRKGEREFIFSIIANGANGKARKTINDIAKAIIDNAEE
jgi:D-alanyl-D-alanine carboxypeptidase/D-alanyl-D-alanine-endopeptidase (penicillin-binding protein 4)